MKQISLELSYHKKQREIFFESDARFKVIAKGRRFGLTRGFANYVIERMLEGCTPILWVDTVYGNIERYVDRYFKPVLAGMPKGSWQFRSMRNDLKILGSVCDFRSADKPENIEGFGYKLVILNEAGIILKDRNLWNESIRPMILDYKADVLIGGTPKGKYLKRVKEEHLFYELFKRGMDRKDGETQSIIGEEKNNWQSFNYSTYDNPLLDRAEIDEMVSEISPALREQEVFGRFVDSEQDGIIKRDWWRFYPVVDVELFRGAKIIQSWDTAFKKNAENDYSVCTTWAVCDNGYYLLDVWRGRVEFPELKKIVATKYEEFGADEVLIEDMASGQSLIQELERGTRIPIKGIKVEQDKITRAHVITPLIEAGKIYLPENAVWLKDFMSECEDFPNGQFDDAVDSMSQALAYLKEKSRRQRGGVVSIKSNFVSTLELFKN